MGLAGAGQILSTGGLLEKPIVFMSEQVLGGDTQMFGMSELNMGARIGCVSPRAAHLERLCVCFSAQLPHSLAGSRAALHFHHEEHMANRRAGQMSGGDLPTCRLCLLSRQQ